MFTDMLDAELAKSISQSGGIGLAPLVQNQLKIIQESAKTNSSQ
jgi:Rod binding domain-containing protein